MQMHSPTPTQETHRFPTCLLNKLPNHRKVLHLPAMIVGLRARKSCRPHQHLIGKIRVNRSVDNPDRGAHENQLRRPPVDIFKSTNNSSFYMPEIKCLLDLRLHPDYDVIKNIVDEWLIEAVKPENETSRELMRQWRIPLLMCLATPEGKKGKLVLATKVLAWMFVADDVLDDMTEPYAYMGISDTMICAVLEGQLNDQLNSLIRRSSAMRAFSNLWLELVAGMPTMQRLRFEKSMKEFFQSVRVLNNLRNCNKPLSLHDYIELRRISAGVYPSFILSEYALGVEQDEETLENSLIKQLEVAAVDHIAWVNDLYSLRKEYFKGEWHSLPSLLCIKEGYELQAAILKACSMVEATEREFTRLCTLIKASSNLMEKKGLSKYINTLGFWMSGNLHWSSITARYHGLNHLHGHLSTGMAILHPL